MVLDLNTTTGATFVIPELDDYYYDDDDRV